MTLRSFLIVTAIISWLFGLGFLLVPRVLADIYGVPPSPEVAMLNRFFGSAMFGLGLFSWALRDIKDAALTSRVLVAHGIHDVIGCLVSIHATTTHLLNAMGWGSVFIYGALATGCVYLYRAAPLRSYRIA
jgi:hypothetical protein